MCLRLRWRLLTLVLRPTVQLCARAGLRVYACQLRALRDLGCAFGQGYLFDRPLAGAQALALATTDAAPWSHLWADA